MNNKYKELYNYLLGNNMTSLDENSFYNEYSQNDEKFSKLYSYLQTNKMTSLDPETFKLEYFGTPIIKKKSQVESTESDLEDGSLEPSSTTTTGQLEPSIYILPNNPGALYRKKGDSWLKKIGENYIPLSKGDVRARERILDKQAVLASDFQSDWYSNQAKEIPKSQYATQEQVNKAYPDLPKERWKGATVTPIDQTIPTEKTRAFEQEEAKDSILPEEKIEPATYKEKLYMLQEGKDNENFYKNPVTEETYLYWLDNNGKPREGLDPIKSQEAVDLAANIIGESQMNQLSKINKIDKIDLNKRDVDKFLKKELYGSNFGFNQEGNELTINSYFPGMNGDDEGLENSITIDLSKSNSSSIAKEFLRYNLFTKKENESLENIKDTESYIDAMINSNGKIKMTSDRVNVISEWARTEAMAVENDIKRNEVDVIDKDIKSYEEKTKLFKKRVATGKMTQEEFDKENDDLSKLYKDISIKQKRAQELSKRAQKLISAEELIQTKGTPEERGSTVGALVKSFTAGMSNLALTGLDYSLAAGNLIMGDEKFSKLIDGNYGAKKVKGLTDAQIANAAQATVKDFAKEKYDLGWENITGTNKEYIRSENRGMIPQALNAVAESFGTAATGGALGVLSKAGSAAAKLYGTAAFFSMSYNAMEDQMRGPDFDHLTENEKKLISVPYGLVIGQMEKWGFDVAVGAGKNPLFNKFANYIVTKTFKSLPRNAGLIELNSAIQKNIGASIAKGLIKITGAGVSEGNVEFMQQEFEGIQKFAVNEILKNDNFNEEYFKDAEDLTKAGGWTSLLGQGWDAFKLGALAGGMTSAGASVKNNIVDILSNNKFDIYKSLVLNTESRNGWIASIKEDQKNGKISPEEMNKQIDELNKSYSVLTKIPASLTTQSQREAFSLLQEREIIQNEIKDKDPNLVVKETNRIKEINEALKTTSENATKEDNIKQQEGTAEGGISEYQGTGEGQQKDGVSQGGQRETTINEADSGDSTVASKVQQEEQVATLRAEEQAELLKAIPKIESYKVNGEIDKTLMPKTVLAKYNKIYDKYDKLISPLLETTGEVAIDKPVITTNTTAEVERVKSLSFEAEDGTTFNIDGTKYEGVGLVVAVDSMNTTTEELTPEMVADFVAERQKMIGDAGVVKAGIYKFPNSNQVSIDLSVVVPETSREQALEFARLAGQESLFDLETFENIKTGATGENPMKFTPEQHREISKALKEGRMPNVFGTTAETTNNLLTKENVKEFASKQKTTAHKLIVKAAKMVLNAMPGVKIYIHNNGQELVSAVDSLRKQSSKQQLTKEEKTGIAESSGIYVDGAIHIDLESATIKTVFHEAFHALTEKMGMSSEATLLMAKGLKNIISDKDIKQKLENFISQYETAKEKFKEEIEKENKKRIASGKSAMNEKETDEYVVYLNDLLKSDEFLAELTGILSEAEQELTTTKLQQFKTLINNIAKKLGLPVIFSASATAQDAADFINTMSKKLRTGKEIKDLSAEGKDGKIKRQVEKLFLGETPKFKSLDDVSKYIQSWVNENKLFDKSIEEVSDQEVINKFSEHVLNEIRAWESIKGSEYVGFYNEDIPQRLNPELQKFAKQRYGRELTGEEVSLYHMVSAFASPSADPHFDSSKGLEVFDKYMMTGNLSAYGTEQATIWGTDSKGKRYDTGKLKFDEKGNPVYKQVAKAYATTSLEKFNNIVNNFNGDVSKAVNWVLSNHSFDDASKMMGKPTTGAKANQLDENEYFTKENGGTGVFAITGAKLGSYILNRIGDYSTVTKDMWYARTLARLAGESLTEKGKAIKSPWASNTKQGLRKRKLADKAFEIVAKKLGTSPADVQQKIWDFEKRLYEKLGAVEKTSYASDGLKSKAKQILSQQPSKIKFQKNKTDKLTAPVAGNKLFNEPLLDKSGSSIKFQKTRQETRMDNEAEAIFKKSLDRGVPWNFAIQNVIDYIQISKWYEEASDIDREQKIRDFKISKKQKLKKAPSVAKIMGTPKPTMVTVNEMTSMRDQIKLEARAAREAKGDLNQKRKLLSTAIKGLVKLGKLTTRQAAIIIDRIGYVNLDNQVMVNRLADYAARVFEKADYQERLSRAFAFRKGIRKLLKGDIQAEVVGMAKKFSKIDPSMVDDIEKYLEMAEIVKNAIKPSKINRKDLDVNMRESMNIDSVSEFTNDAIENQERILKEELLAVHSELVDAGVIDDKMSLSEIESTISSLKEKEDNANYKADILTFLSKRIDTMSAIIKDILIFKINPMTGEKVALTEKNIDLISRMLNIDINNVSIKEAIFIAEAMDNFINNNITSSVEAVIEKHEGATELENLIADKVVASPLRKYFSTYAGQLFSEQVASMPILFEKLFVGAKKGLMVAKKMGWTALINGVNKAEKMFNTTVDSYFKQYSKTKPNGKNFNDAENVYERGMLAFLSRNVSGTVTQQAEEFKRRVEVLKESIKSLLEGSTKEQKMGELYQKVYDKLNVESGDIDVIHANADKINRSAVGWWINQWGTTYSDLSDISLSVYNTVLSSDTSYTTDRYKLLGKSTSEEIIDPKTGSFGRDIEFLDKNKAGVMMPSTKPSASAVSNASRYISLDFDVNNTSAYKGALIDINTAAAIRKIDGFINSDNLAKLIPTEDDRKIFTGRIKDYIQAAKNKMPLQSDKMRLLDQLTNFLGGIGVAKALGGIDQVVKQTLPIALSTFVNSGRFDLVMPGSSASVWIDSLGMAISNRGQESQSTIESVDRRLEKASGLIDKSTNAFVDVQQFWLKYFLSKPDLFIAKSSFISYYKQYLSNNNKSTDIDWATHNVNQDAADYAMLMVDRQQNVSDAKMAGKIFSSQNSTTKIMRKIFLPFASFSLNQKSRMVSDIKVLGMNSGASKQDKAIAARSLASLPFEMALYQSMSLAIRLGYLAIAKGIIGAVADDDDEEKERLLGIEISKELKNATKYPLRSMITDFLSPAPVLDNLVVGGANALLRQSEDKEMIDDAVSKKNLMLEVLGKDKMDEDQKEKFIKKFKKDHEYQLFNDEQKSWGTIGIGTDLYIEIMDNAKTATTGQYTQDYMGNESERFLLPKDQDNIKNAVIFETLFALGILPRDVNTVTKNIIKLSKKNSLTETQYEKYKAVGKETGGKVTGWKMDLTKSKSKLETTVSEIEWIEKHGGLNEKQGKEYVKLSAAFDEVSYRDLQRIQSGKTADQIINSYSKK